MLSTAVYYYVLFVVFAIVSLLVIVGGAIANPLFVAFLVAISALLFTGIRLYQSISKFLSVRLGQLDITDAI